MIGHRVTWVYVGWVTLFSTLAGLLYGAWVDGTSAWWILAGLAAFLVVLSMGLTLVGRRQRGKALAGETPVYRPGAD